MQAQPSTDPRSAAAADPMAAIAGILAGLPRPKLIATLRAVEATADRVKHAGFAELFPEEGPYRRSLYPKHLEFFAAGRTHRERCFMAGNRTGKTVAAGFEMTCHLTGLYPDWWEGKTFDRPVRAWAAGKTNETTRNILMRKLLGDVAWRGQTKTVSGLGIIPKHLIGDVSWRQGIPNLVDTVMVRHARGGWSSFGFKSFEQGRGSFEGDEIDVAWEDEEPPLDIHGEIVVRTATTGGIVMLTFTPLEGMSDVVMSFLPQDLRPAA